MSSSPPGVDRFAIVPLDPYQPAPSNAIMHGSRSAVMERIIDSVARNDALELKREAAAAADQLERTKAQQAQAIAQSARMIRDGTANLRRRLDALERRRAAQAKADAAAEAKRIVDFLASLPDPDGPATHHHYPSGELHALPASEPADRAQLAAQDQGTLPKELVRKAPPDPGSYPVDDPAELAHPLTQPYRQPVAVELSEE